MAADFGIGLDFGIPDGADRAQHYRRILEMLPSEFKTAWISDHLQFGDRPQLEGWTTLTHLAAEFPRDRVFDMDWDPPADQEMRGRDLARQYHVLNPRQLENCSICHR